MNLGKNLQILRKMTGMTQEELSETTGVSRQTVSKWEKGRSAPDADMLVSLAAVLEVSTSDLIGEDVRTTDSVEDLALQTALINEQLAIQNRRVDSVINFAKCVGLMCLLLMLLVPFLLFLKQCSQPVLNPYFTTVEFTFDDEIKYFQINALPDDPNRISQDWFLRESLASELDVPLEEIPSNLDESLYAEDPNSMANYLNALSQYIRTNGGRVISIEYWHAPNGNADEPYLVLPG